MRIAIGGLGCFSDLLEFINSQDVEIVGVDSIVDREGHTDLREKAKELGLPIKSYEEIVALKPDVFFSLSYLKIIGKELIDNCICVNLHAGKLPEYGGRNPITQAIQNGEQYAYCTLHLMTEKLDAGDIIAERRIPISIMDTAKTLHSKLYQEAKKMFKEEFESIIKGKFKTRKNEGRRKIYKKNLDKEVVIGENTLQTYNKIRSLDFPPYEPAYYLVNGEKYHITTEQYVYWLLSREKEKTA